MLMGTTGTQRSKSLHNFTMPGELRWGNQRFLRCIKVNSDPQISPLRRPDSDQRRRENSTLQSRTHRGEIRATEIDDFLNRSRKISRTSPPDSTRRFDDGIAAIREKVMLDLQTAADQMKHAIFKDGLDEGEVPPPPPPAAEGELSRPWNLRTRRADLKTSASASRLVSSTNVDAAASAGGSENGNVGGKKERAMFSVALSRNEIEEDFYSMVGHRPPRRPKKRNRNVQRQLDTLFPGLWLSEVTSDMYKVNVEGEGR